MEGVPGHYLKNDFKSVDHKSKHALIEMRYQIDPVLLIERKIPDIQFTDISFKPYWKWLRRFHPMKSGIKLLLVSNTTNAIISVLLSTISSKGTGPDGEQNLGCLLQIYGDISKPS